NIAAEASIGKAEELRSQARTPPSPPSPPYDPPHGPYLISWSWWHGRGDRVPRQLSIIDAMTLRRFPPPWTLEQIPGGYKVKDANGQSGGSATHREQYR